MPQHNLTTPGLRPRVNLPPPPTAAPRRTRTRSYTSFLPTLGRRSDRATTSPSSDDSDSDSDASTSSAKTTASRRERSEWVQVSAPEMPACEEVGAWEADVSDWEEGKGRRGGEVEGEDGEWMDVREGDAEAPVVFSKRRFVGSVLETLAKLP